MRRRQLGALRRARSSRRAARSFTTALPLTAALLGLLGLAAAGCGAPTASRAAGPTATPAGVVAATPSGNTGEVCQQINATVRTDLTAFGTDLGTFAGHQSGKNSQAASKASAAALAKLSTLAGKIRSAAQVATVAKVSAAASRTAANLEQLAKDPTLLAGVHAATDVPPVIRRVTSATDPLINACV
jgi:hypothetical protein